jgi:hypothetical protein
MVTERRRIREPKKSGLVDYAKRAFLFNNGLGGGRISGITTHTRSFVLFL